MHLLIADFGSSKILNDDDSDKLERIESSDSKSKAEKRSSFVGTAHYCPPEILKGRFSNYASDLFSYGAIIYEFICGKPAFNGDNEYVIFQKIQTIDYSFPENFDPCARDLIEKLLKLEPSERLGSQDQEELYISIRQHSFFSDINFNKIFHQTSPLQILADIQTDTFKITDDMEPGKVP
jgi:3-phosphoinositide dependent protein kinase-1